MKATDKAAKVPCTASDRSPSRPRNEYSHGKAEPNIGQGALHWLQDSFEATSLAIQSFTQQFSAGSEKLFPVPAAATLFLQPPQVLSPPHEQPLAPTGWWNKKKNRQSPSHFPCQVCPVDGGRCQDLLAVGTKNWGAGPILPLAEIYSFAVFVDSHQARKAQISPVKEDIKDLDPLLVALKQSADVNLTLIVKVSRNLPLGMMTREYERILKRRLKAAGADPNDPALCAVLDAFRQSLPDTVRAGRSIKKGTLLTFSRRQGKMLTAKAGADVLRSVESAELCEAVFDLYLGKNPVSKSAVHQATRRLTTLLKGEERVNPLCMQTNWAV